MSLTCSLCEMVLSLLLPLLHMRLPEPQSPQGIHCLDLQVPRKEDSHAGRAQEPRVTGSFDSALTAVTWTATPTARHRPLLSFLKATLIYFLVLLSVFSHSIVSGSLRPPWTTAPQASPTPRVNSRPLS